MAADPASNPMMAMMAQCQQMMAMQSANAQAVAQDLAQEQMDKVDWPKGKGVNKGKQKGQEIPESIKKNPACLQMVNEFIDAFPSFEGWHKERLYNCMATRTDTYQEDLETLHMAL